MPLPLHSFYKKYKSNIPNAIYVWKELVSLPFYSDLKNNEISYIIKALREFDDKFF
jgi:dTDP-4-amino-4,6-dideoxygalactose transaminase